MLAGLRLLNALGYGQSGSDLVLHLVYNPQGPVLPPAQEALERDYQRVLAEEQGVVFHRLFALANMPIQRFAAVLIASGQLEPYLELLRRAHVPANLDGVMCRRLISVDWRGGLHDCDFNQMLDLGLDPADLGDQVGERPHLRDLLSADPAGGPIRVGDHCWGCTAGQGSSCSGSLA